MKGRDYAPKKMNSPSPMIPQGSTPEQKQQGRKRFYVAFFTIVSANALLLVLALFIQGCKRQPTPEQLAAEQNAAAAAAAMSNSVPVTDMASVSNATTQVSNAVATIVDTTPVQPIVPTTTATATEHVIVKGDNLGDIAKKYGVSLKALKAANPTVDEKRLQINHKLVIPAPTPTTDLHAAAAAVVGAVADAGEQLYEVKSGDTLGAIAKTHGTTVKAIQEANNLKDTRIVVKQKLKIPAKTSAPASVLEPAPVAAPVTTPR